MRHAIGPVLAVVLGLSPLAAADPDTTSLEELVARSADTAEEHRAMAEHFKRKAEAARAEVAVHRRMGRATDALEVGVAVQMKVHCNRIADTQTALAKMYAELANLYEAEAEKTSSTP